MSKWMVLIAMILTTCVCVASAGCSSKPVDELKMARTAMDEAQGQEASTYAPDDWARARGDWEEAIGLINMGRYEEARSVLTIAAGKFNTARDNAARRLEAIKREDSDLQTSIRIELNNLEQAVQKSSVKASVKKMVESSLPLIEEKISSMRAADDDKNYLRARMLGKEAWQWIMDLQEKAGIVR